MAKVLGLGGIFFKADNPEKLCEWYKTHLGLSIDFPHGSVLRAEQLPKGAYAVWSPFPKDTDYFEPSNQSFMINFVVDDIEGALNQVKEGGAKVVGEIEESEFGKFGKFIDPEGNKVELWKPAGE